MEELYRVFSRGIRFYLCRQLGAQDLDDRVHETFLIVTQAIRRGDVREPERLMGYVRTVVRRQVAAYIEEDLPEPPPAHRSRLRPGGERRRQGPRRGRHRAPEPGNRAGACLKAISGRDREILIRFYLHEQAPEQICREMNLTETQFRLLKSRAKARFGELGKRRMERAGAAAGLAEETPNLTIVGGPSGSARVRLDPRFGGSRRPGGRCGPGSAPRAESHPAVRFE